MLSLLLFGPLAVLLILLGLSLRDRHAKPSGYAGALRMAIMAYGYLLCCGSPAIIFPPVAGLSIAGLFSGLAFLRRSRHANTLWFLTIAVERGVPLGPELAATGDAIGGREGRRWQQLADDIDDGATLPEALAARGELIPTTALLDARVGEQTGRLAETLRAASLRTSGAVGASSQASYLAGAAVYVWAVTLVLIGVVGFCMYNIVPKFKAIFEDFDVALPDVSIALIHASDVFVNWWFLFLPFLFVLLALSLIAGECYRRGWANVSLPWLTRWFPRLDTPGILRNLSLAVDSQTPLGDVLETLASHHHRPHIAERLRQVTAEVTNGGDAWQSLRGVGLLNPDEVGLLKAGESMGNLPWVLRNVAERIEGRRTERAKWWFEILRPWPILLLGLSAAFFVFGMFLPLLKLLRELS